MSDKISEGGTHVSRRGFLKLVGGLFAGAATTGAAAKVATDIARGMDEAAKTEQQRIKDNSLQINMDELYDNDNLEDVEVLSRLGVIIENVIEKKKDWDKFRRMTIMHIPQSGSISQLELNYDKDKHEFRIDGKDVNLIVDDTNPNLKDLFKSEIGQIKVDQVTQAEIEMVWDPFVVNTSTLPEELSEAYKAPGLTGEKDLFFQKSNLLLISNWNRQKGFKTLSEKYKFHEVDPRIDITREEGPIEVTEFRRKSFEFDQKRNKQKLVATDGSAFVNPFETSDQEKFNRCLNQSRKIFNDHQDKLKKKE